MLKSNATDEDIEYTKLHEPEYVDDKRAFWKVSEDKVIGCYKLGHGMVYDVFNPKK